MEMRATTPAVAASDQQSHRRYWCPAGPPHSRTSHWVHLYTRMGSQQIDSNSPMYRPGGHQRVQRRGEDRHSLCPLRDRRAVRVDVPALRVPLQPGVPGGVAVGPPETTHNTCESSSASWAMGERGAFVTRPPN